MISPLQNPGRRYALPRAIALRPFRALKRIASWKSVAHLWAIAFRPVGAPEPGASLCFAPGYRIPPFQGFENYVFAPTGHDGKAQGNALGKERYKNNPKP